MEPKTKEIEASKFHPEGDDSNAEEYARLLKMEVGLLGATVRHEMRTDTKAAKEQIYSPDGHTRLYPAITADDDGSMRVYLDDIRTEPYTRYSGGKAIVSGESRPTRINRIGRKILINGVEVRDDSLFGQ